MVRTIGLIGFGKTGKNIAQVILNNSQYSLAWVYKQSDLLSGRNVASFLGIQSSNKAEIITSKQTSLKKLIETTPPVDFIIDFSNERTIYEYGNEAANAGIKIISAISHYSEEEKALLKSLAQQTVVFWSPNITLGINYLMFAAKFLKNIAPKVDIELIEEHFKHKQGVSGTALRIAEELEIDSDSINSIRAGGIVGKHEIVFGFPNQTIRLTHESISREAFGNGALFVADKIQHYNTGFFQFEDILAPYFTIPN